jgi:hypothetical protein
MSINSFLAEPLPLMCLCRRVIRQSVGRVGVARGGLTDLGLPKPIRDYLEYKDLEAPQKEHDGNGNEGDSDASKRMLY